jgi:hypothetical protein
LQKLKILPVRLLQYIKTYNKEVANREAMFLTTENREELQLIKVSISGSRCVRVSRDN